MHLFKISGDITPVGKWSSTNSKFTGYFRQDGALIEGYVEDTVRNYLNPTRYINGLYLDTGQLLFYRMCNDIHIPTTVFVFPSINEQGLWSDFTYFSGFFHKNFYDGYATVKVEEITSEVEKEKLLPEIAKIFSEESAKADTSKKDLMERINSLRDFLGNISQYEPKP